MGCSAKLNECIAFLGQGQSFLLRELIFLWAFLGGVLQEMGIFRGISVDKTWCVAGNNVVNGWSFCGA
jgi:hypothetical protein